MENQSILEKEVQEILTNMISIVEKEINKKVKKSVSIEKKWEDVFENRKLYEDSTILSSDSWQKGKYFTKLIEKDSQIKYYMKNKSSDAVLELVKLESKSFGTVSENMIKEILYLGPRTSTQNDATLFGKKIEIKSARYWCADECKWQHIEPNHDYEYILFSLLDFHGFKIWIMKKSQMMNEMREKKILTEQGKQGWWCKKKDILPYLTPINTVYDLYSFINSN
jgi:hypothetical protein